MVKSVYGPVLLCHSQLKHKIPELFISKEVGRRGAEEGRRGVGGSEMRVFMQALGFTPLLLGKSPVT